MRGALVVPTAGAEHFLAPRVGGVSVAERVRRAARDAGLGVYFWKGGATEPGGACPGGCRCIVLRPGFLPDAAFLRGLVAATPKPAPYLVEGEPSVFVVWRNGDQPCLPAEGPTYAAWAEEIAGGLRPSRVRVAQGTLHDVRTAPGRRDLENRLFRSAVKDTEGFMSRHFERKLSIALSRRLVWTPVTPNQMSFISIAVGLLGALFMGMGGTSRQIAGALLFLTHSVLDGCDGEIARVKLEQSRFGGLIDFWGDNGVHTAVFVAIALEWYGQQGNPWALGFGALAVMGSLGSAALVYVSTMRRRTGQTPLYTSVSERESKGRIAATADFLTRRDFIYLVVLLALFGRLEWFLVLSALGAPLFFLLLVAIRWGDRRRIRDAVASP